MKKFLPIIIILGVAGFVVKSYVFGETFRYAGTLEATKVDLSARLAASKAKVSRKAMWSKKISRWLF